MRRLTASVARLGLVSGSLQHMRPSPTMASADRPGLARRGEAERFCRTRMHIPVYCEARRHASHLTCLSLSFAACDFLLRNLHGYKGLTHSSSKYVPSTC